MSLSEKKLDNEDLPIYFWSKLKTQRNRVFFKKTNGEQSIHLNIDY